MRNMNHRLCNALYNGSELVFGRIGYRTKSDVERSSPFTHQNGAPGQQTNEFGGEFGLTIQGSLKNALSGFGSQAIHLCSFRQRIRPNHILTEFIKSI